MFLLPARGNRKTVSNERGDRTSEAVVLFSKANKTKPLGDICCFPFYPKKSWSKRFGMSVSVLQKRAIKTHVRVGFAGKKREICGD